MDLKERDNMATVRFGFSENETIPRDCDLTFEAAEQAIVRARRTAPEGGCYDKTDFLITWEDGSQYKGRIDLQGFETAPEQTLLGHIREHCEYLLTEFESVALRVHTPEEIATIQATARVVLIQLRILEVEAARQENRNEIQAIEAELRRHLAD